MDTSLPKTPLHIKKQGTSLLKKHYNNDKPLLRCIKITRPLKEDVIYRSQKGDFMKGKYPNLTIVNKLDLLNNSSRTTARYSSETLGNIERTSDDITKLIGQKNYDIVFSALCSVISQELRIQGILALLTVPKRTKNISCQYQTAFVNPDIEVISEKVIENQKSAKVIDSKNSNVTSVSTQTDQTCSALLQRLKLKKKLRKPVLGPYVVKDSKSTGNIKKVVINPQQFEATKELIKRSEFFKTGKQYYNKKRAFLNKNSTSSENHHSQLKEPYTQIETTVNQFASNTLNENNIKIESVICSNETTFPDLKEIVDEDSNISEISYGNISITSSSIPNLLVENPTALLNDIDKHIQEPKFLESTTLTMLDGSQVKIKSKPEDQFHIATPEILKYLSPEERSKLLWHQAYIDWKYCLNSDEDGNLPIHLAVLNNDVELLRRQCVVLKSRNESVDLMGNGKLTALQMSIFQETSSCTDVLLQHGANPLFTDDEQRTTVHLAAEISSDHLKVVISYCQRNARYILHDNNLWKPELETTSDEEIAKYLLSIICRMYDNQGYTPLILASKLGNYTNVSILLDADPTTVNLPMPNCGNTALYVLVAAACLDNVAAGRDKSEVGEHFLKTAEILVKSGADPAYENNSSSSVNHLLNECTIPNLSVIIANTFVSVKYSEPNMNFTKDISSFMLVKDDDGEVNFKEMKSEKTQAKLNDSEKPLPKIINDCNVATNLKPKSKVAGTIEKMNIKTTSGLSEIIFPNKVVKQKEILPTKVDLLTTKQSQDQIKIVSVVSGSSWRNTNSTDKQALQNPKRIPNIIRVSKRDLSNSGCITSSNFKSTILLTSDQTKTSKRMSIESREHTRVVPIKKQKRDNVN
ncbi:unnamed protein product [Parnassius apollo]|uniref:(apollo) hypothetical protein n=1 Tax=Parnassius apollo TaxID=110799 RepID=A0A8S3WA01_PARAO|nr:unnamed protein product [Parnassius apollo]